MTITDLKDKTKLVYIVILTFFMIFFTQNIYANTSTTTTTSTDIQAFTERGKFTVTVETENGKKKTQEGEITAIKKAETVEDDSTSINLKDGGFSSINWDFNLGIDWESSNDSDTKKLKLKDINGNTTNEKSYELIYNKSPLDAVQNENINGNQYLLRYDYSNMDLKSYTGSEPITNSTTKYDITINDVPYEASKITISCTQSNPVTVTLSPKDFITDYNIIEVGVRAEYSLDENRKIGIVKRTKNIDGNNGEFTFKNIPEGSATKYSAYYTDKNNNEYSTL